MAKEIQIEPGSLERTAKIRHPVIVPVLTVITLGIYGLYWWYQVNRELRDLGRARGVEGLGEKPVNSLLAFFPGAIIIVPPYVSLYNAVKRIGKAQETTVGEVTFNGWIILILILASFVVGVAGIVVPGYIQSELNKVWENVEANSAGAPLEPPTAPETPEMPEAPPVAQ
jgi:hypothetical protein